MAVHYIKQEICEMAMDQAEASGSSENWLNFVQELEMKF